MNILWPKTCVLCNHVSDTTLDLCSICQQTLPRLTDRCYQCGDFIKLATESVLCTACKNNPPAFDRLCGLFAYQSPVNKLVTAVKFNNSLIKAELLGKLFFSELQNNWYQNTPLPEAIIPVPLHYKRLRTRGYNQVIEIIRSTSKKLKIPMLLDTCVRNKSTKAQAKLPLHLRKRNLQNSFKLEKPIKLKHIAIVDDVVTTTSTVNSLSKKFKTNKINKTTSVEHIDIWCICRA